LPKNTIFTLNLLKTLIIKPGLVSLIFFVVVIPAFVLICLYTFTPTFTTLMLSALASAELTLSPTPKITAALSLATCV
jgi:hypothetical protein